MQNNLEDNNLEQAQGVTVAPRQLDKSQKIAVAVLAFFAILVMIVWIVQTKRNLSEPFDYAATPNQDTTCADGNCGSVSDADLRLKDTDKDGLNDYDELNVYNTSPYLEDSDSDGYSDRQEVESQNDPTCPFGQQCNIAPASPTRLDDSSLLLSGPQEPDSALVDIDPTEKVLSGQGDAATLRAVLIESGMDPQVLNKISDEELMTSYEDILSN